MEDNWIEVEPRNNKKEIYAEKVYKGNSVRVVKVSEKRQEEKDRYRETDTRRRKNKKTGRVSVEKDRRSIEKVRKKREDEDKSLDTEEEESLVELSLERVDKMQRLINKIDEKIRKLENMIVNMLNSHNIQMKKIIKLITVKEENRKKGKEERETRKIIEYTTEEDEFY